jgi:flagellar biosynthetic protein FliR
MEALLIGKVFIFAMVLTRITTFFLVVPILGSGNIPATMKIAATVMLSIFFSIINPQAAVPAIYGAEQGAVIQAIILLGGEAAYGLALGAIANIIFSAVKLGGSIMETQMGLSMAQIIDPMSEEHGTPLAALLEMIFILAFLAANGHHLLIRVIQKSYEYFPAGKIPTVAALAGNILEATSVMFVAGLRLAAPILAALLVLLVVLAILSRVVPEMEIFFISFPLRILLGFIIVVALVPFLNEFVGEAAKLMARLLPL